MVNIEKLMEEINDFQKKTKQKKQTKKKTKTGKIITQDFKA